MEKFQMILLSKSSSGGAWRACGTTSDPISLSVFWTAVNHSLYRATYRIHKKQSCQIKWPSQCSFQKNPRSVHRQPFREHLLIPPQERISRVIEFSRVTIH